MRTNEWRVAHGDFVTFCVGHFCCRSSHGTIVLTTQMWASDFAFKADNFCRVMVPSF